MELINISESNINLLTQDISNELFNKVKLKEVILGDDITNFSEFNQINRFILFQIFIEWKAFAQKLKHSYFNHKADEVKEALNHYQNTLSKHIQIEQRDFKPLLEKACFNTLKLLSNPIETFTNFFFISKETVSLELFTHYIDYFSDFGFLLKTLAVYYKNHHISEISKLDFLSKLDEVVKAFEIEKGISLTDYRKKLFFNLTKKSMDELININTTTKTIVKEEIPEVKTKNFEHTVSSKQNVSQRVIDKFQNQTPTSLNEVISQKNNFSLTSLSLNKKFTYISKLFNGDDQAFKVFLEKVDHMETMEDALLFLKSEVMEKYNIQLDDAYLIDFIAFLEKKYN